MSTANDGMKSKVWHSHLWSALLRIVWKPLFQVLAFAESKTGHVEQAYTSILNNRNLALYSIVCYRTCRYTKL